MWFRVTGIYLNPVPPADYAADPLLPALISHAEPNPGVLRSFLVRRHVEAVIVGSGTTPQLPDALAALGLKPVSLAGIWFYEV